VSMATMGQRLHVRVREEDGSFWATVDEYPGVFAAGDDLEELRASLEEGICLIKAEPGGEPPDLRLSRLRLEPGEATASAELVPL
jgi:predicted RNase H-like HicB family nuclease